MVGQHEASSRSRHWLLGWCSYRHLRALAVVIPLLVYPAPSVDARIAPNDDRRCLATAIYHEARGEPVKARRAVVDTVTHRMLESGKSACAVIAEKRQFSWFSRKGWKHYDDDQRELLAETLEQPRILKDAKFKWFFSGKAPAWARKMVCRPIGNLKFCRERG